MPGLYLDITDQQAIDLRHQFGQFATVQVDSAAIGRVSYNTASRTLYVVFNRGGLYAYQDVPFQRVLELLTAESLGHYLNERIIGQYPTRYVGGEGMVR